MDSRVIAYLIFSVVYIGYFIVRKLRIMRNASIQTLEYIFPEDIDAKEFFIKNASLIVEYPDFAEFKLIFLKADLEEKTEKGTLEEEESGVILKLGITDYLLENAHVFHKAYRKPSTEDFGEIYENFIDSQKRLVKRQNATEGIKWFLEQIVCELPPILLLVFGFRDLSIGAFILLGWVNAMRYHNLGGDNKSTPIVNYLITQVPFLIGFILF